MKKQFLRNILTCSVLHSHSVQGQIGGWVYVHPGVAQYMLDDVLCNVGAYIYGHSVCQCPLCLLEYGAHKHATPGR